MSPPLAAALNHIPKSCLWRERHTSLHEAPVESTGIWNPLPETAHGLWCQGEFSWVSTAPTEGGLSPGKLQSAQQEILSNPDPLSPSNGLSPLPWERRGLLCVAAVAYTSVCLIFITLLRAEPACCQGSGGGNKQEGHSSVLVPVCCLGQLPALAVPWESHLKASSDEKLPE